MESADNNMATKIDEATLVAARPPARSILFRTALTKFNNQQGSSAFPLMLLLVYSAHAVSKRLCRAAESERDFLFRLLACRQLL
jgi:hypothetical protein